MGYPGPIPDPSTGSSTTSELLPDPVQFIKTAAVPTKFS
eukprot:SAG31_NODE_648_length_13204_cov_57.612908_8_plen_39_part_00